MSSHVASTKHIRKAGLTIFFKPDVSRQRPALVRIMISAIFLSSEDIERMLTSIRFNT